MKLPRGIRRLLRVGGARESAARDLDAELAFHFEETVRALKAQGMDEEGARQEARRRFGDEEAYRRAIARIDGAGVRTRKRRETMDVLQGTLRFAVRGVWRAPGFTSAIVVILALGIGANAVIFGVVDRLLLSPPQHVVDADAVRHIYLERTVLGGRLNTSRVLTYPDYADLVGVDAFSRVAAYTSPRSVVAGLGDDAEEVRAVMASAGLFPLLGVAPALGRFYGAEEDALDANPTAVLTYEFWERAFGADPAVLGRVLNIGQGRYEVVGITPAGFTGAELTPVDVWLPLTRAQQLETGGDGWAQHRGWWWLSAVVRLVDGVTPEAAAAQATAMHRGARAEMIQDERYDAEARILAAPVIAGRGPQPAAEAQLTWWLAGVSLIVLLVACFNVANLLLARATRWRRELAVRTALGVTRARLLGELLTESLVLATLGAAGAFLVVRWGGGVVHGILLPNVAFTDGGMTPRLLLFVGVTTVMTALLAGVLPALQASRTEVAQALKSSGGGSSQGGARTRGGLLVAQAAFSVVLLVGAGLFVGSLNRARDMDLGFDTDRVLLVQPDWSETLPGETRLQIMRDARDQLLRLPGVENAGLSYVAPFWGSVSMGRPRVPGLDSVPRHASGGPYLNKVGPGYFAAMGLAVVEGRPIRPSDEAENAPPVAVVSESMAQAYWPTQSALGQCMIFGAEASDPPCTTVVGVVENHRRDALVEDDPHFLYYVNQPHPEFEGPPQLLLVRTTRDPEEVVSAVQAAVQGTSPQIRFARATVLEDLLAPQLRSWTLGASVFSVFGLLALVVAGIGLYSVLAFEITLQQRELGIRAALGADMPGLIRMVLARAVRLVTAGVVLGLALAVASAGFVEPLLFQMSARNPGVYGTVAVVLLVVAVVAGSIPAWRATRVDPRVALQSE